MQTRARPWWLTLTMGIVALVLGAVLLWAPAKDKVDAYQFIIAFLGFYWLIGGIVELFSLLYDHTAWGWKLFMGIVSIVAGSYVLMYPVAAGVALPRIFVLILGLWGAHAGDSPAVPGLQRRRLGRRHHGRRGDHLRPHPFG